MGDGNGADVEDIGTDTDGDRTMGDVNVPIADVKAQLREMIIGADQIQIGADLSHRTGGRCRRRWCQVWDRETGQRYVG